ncbi:Oligosaccharyl transferase STT3 subunit, putative [Angomonas deanei]|uniref:dolichyl-diphosphooligosaccharide--protein glycotransferase n=1 Tax=Angomonas deanei TaxID=59799 RepID=A0A7G2C5Y7_9TRYP|nr:Oligosaccharyl transferase STT3 subunit, putative [Angomonas deanei]
MWPIKLFLTVVSFILFFQACLIAYTTRMRTVTEYGRLIHEFDPWFNYRATEYLSAHGWHAFFHWFDEMSWYPIGRPVGTSIYPGLQLTAVALEHTLPYFGVNMSLNDICVFMPAWFGAIATFFAGLIGYELTQSFPVMAAAAWVFSINPAHLMRSMAGEFDNECIALAAMLATFYAWVRALRCEKSWPIGVLAGIAYGYMVAAWGGFIFVLNMIVLHAGLCALVDWIRGTYSKSLLYAYTLFFVVGTALAVCVPIVNTTPFKSVEQISAVLLFVLLWTLHLSEHLRERRGLKIHSMATVRLRAMVLCAVVASLLVVALLFAPSGFFRPFSSRVRALFVAHTRTGNPLVDSVAEHQPLRDGMRKAYLHVTDMGWLVGSFVLIASCIVRYNRAKLFLIFFSITTNYFCSRMSRLIILCGPAACITTGYLGATLLDTALSTMFWTSDNTAAHKKTDGDSGENQKGRKARKTKQTGTITAEDPLIEILKAKMSGIPKWSYAAVSFVLLLWAVGTYVHSGYDQHCDALSYDIGHPMIVFNAKLRDGRKIQVRDYLESYEWLRDNTPEDARVLSWWDYGYQLTGIANRTTLADGNTWNHEHIATIGRMLTMPPEEAHEIIRHMADYVYIWAGQNGDLGKSPHMARIGNSVYRDLCAEEDPLCNHFGFHGAYDKPTPSMRKSLLYNLHENGKKAGVKVDPELFQEVYTSPYGLVRIFKVMDVSEESRRWVADPRNHVCEPAPNDWICRGQYPPAEPVQKMLAKRITFQQLEAFGHDKTKDKYYQAYMKQFEREG